MNKSIRLLVEGFFDDEIFNTDNDIKQDIEDLGKYYDYKVGDIYYLNKKPYAICCGEPKYFKDNKQRFCLLNDSKNVIKWYNNNKKLVKELSCFKINYFYLNTFNDFKHIDEDGYGNTQIIKNNYNINGFPAFAYCIELGDNIYFPAIDELQIMYLNKNKLGKYSFRGYNYWSSTQYSATKAYYINIYGKVSYYNNYYNNLYVRPFFNLY